MRCFQIISSIIAISLSSQAALQPGDIAVIGINCDDPDTVAFVALADLAAGEVIRFTDCGWKADNTFRANEGGIAYTVPAGGIARGTVVTKDNPFTADNWSVDNTGFGANFQLSTAGDQIIVFQGDAGSPSFIYALNDKGAGVWQADATDSNTSTLPAGLIEGTTAVAINESDNAKYTGPTSGSVAELLAAIGNNANWSGDNTVRQSIDTAAWSVSGANGDDPNISMPAALDFGIVAPGSVVTQTLTISNSGQSNDLTVSAIIPVSGSTDRYSTGPAPGTIGPGGGQATVAVVYAPGFVTGAVHSAIFAVVSNDPSEPTNAVQFSGMTSYGVLSISNVQYTADASGDSPWLGMEVTVRGICTMALKQGDRLTINNTYILTTPGGGPWSAIAVYDYNHRPEIGDEVEVTGTVDEYYELTELVDITGYEVLSRSNSVPETVLTCAEASQEQYESVFMRLNSVTVSDENLNGTGYEWEVQDATGTCMVDDVCPYRYIWHTGDGLGAIRGIMWYSFSNFKLQPRDDDDFIGRPVLEYALKGMVMTPDGPRSNWYVHVLDDDIINVTGGPPATALTIDTQGIIFPGLIDAHNHPTYNSFGTLQFHNFPFGHRDEWGASDQEYSDWKSKRSVVTGYGSVDESTKATVSKYAEVLELMAGCVTIQGNYSGREYAHPDVILYNIEQHPSRIASDIFPWELSASERQQLKDMIDGGAINAVLIHLSEGPDAVSLEQFNTWYNWGMLNETTAIIHGTPYGTNELAKIAAVGAKILWAPMSNMRLYESTLNIKLAKQAGVKVGLSPDWTPSGTYNMLEELGYAWYLNQTLFDNAYTPREMCEMVTVVNAEACGLEQRYGTIAPGYNAGFCVIEGSEADPYMALINARPKDVKLTIVDGTPRYGDAALVQQFGITGEYVTVGGEQKMLNIAVDHPLLAWSGESFSDIRQHLRDAHATLNTSCVSGNLDSEELQFLDLDLLQKGPDTLPPFRGDQPILAPADGAQLMPGEESTLSFDWKDFWDNLTASRQLMQTEVAIVAADSPETVVQVVTNTIANNESNGSIQFKPGEFGSAQEYAFRFITTDLNGNQRTSVFDQVRFQILPEPGAIAVGWLAVMFIGRWVRR